MRVGEGSNPRQESSCARGTEPTAAALSSLLTACMPAAESKFKGHQNTSGLDWLIKILLSNLFAPRSPEHIGGVADGSVSVVSHWLPKDML